MEEYRRILVATLLQQGIILSVIEVGLIFLTVNSMACINRGLTTTEKQQGWRQDVRVRAVSSILGAIIVGILLLFQCFGMVKDIVSNQYVCTECVYQRGHEGKYRSGWLTNGSVQITADGKTFWLKLPKDHGPEKYPFGRVEGVIWYGENSNVIVAFSTAEEGNYSS